MSNAGSMLPTDPVLQLFVMLVYRMLERTPQRFAQRQKRFAVDGTEAGGDEDWWLRSDHSVLTG